MDGDEKKQIIEDAVHNGSHARYRNPDNAPISASSRGIMKMQMCFQEAGIRQLMMRTRKSVQNGNEASLLIDR